MFVCRADLAASQFPYNLARLSDVDFLMQLKQDLTTAQHRNTEFLPRALHCEKSIQGCFETQIVQTLVDEVCFVLSGGLDRNTCRALLPLSMRYGRCSAEATPAPFTRVHDIIITRRHDARWTF